MAHPLNVVDEDHDGFLEDDDADEVLRVRMPVGTARTFAKRPWEAHTGSGGSRTIYLRDLRLADRPRRAHLRLPLPLVPAPDLVTSELTLTGRLTTASNATFLGESWDTTGLTESASGTPQYEFDPSGC